MRAADPLSNENAHVSQRTVLLLLLCGGLVAAAAGVIWHFSTGSAQPEPPPQVAEDPVKIKEERRNKARDESLAKLKLVARALLDYRDQFGGGLHWPTELDELTASGLLAHDFDFTGPLSGLELAYQPELPMGQRPETWVMAADILMEAPQRYDFYPRHVGRGPQITAVTVVLGDGRVLALETTELNQYAGLTTAVESFERAMRRRQ